MYGIAKSDIVLHPGGTYYIRARFRVPRGRERIRMLSIVSMRDTRLIERSLTVMLRSE